MTRQKNPIQQKVGRLLIKLECFFKVNIIQNIKSFFRRDYEIVIKSLKDAYYRAENWSTKGQLLSIVAADLPTRLLKAEFPELTDWKIKAARAQAVFHGNSENICNIII